MTTKDLEHAAYYHLSKMGTYLCFEVMMPDKRGSGYGNKERVDLLSYETKGIWRFYELKVSKSDFNSKAKKTFLGHFNYYIMPNELYLQVKDDIPKEIGVYVGIERSYARGRDHLECVKKPVKQELRVDHNQLLFALMQSLSRENEKYRFSLREKYEEENHPKKKSK